MDIKNDFFTKKEQNPKDMVALGLNPRPQMLRSRIPLSNQLS
jgi:hypothetical protein